MDYPNHLEPTSPREGLVQEVSGGQFGCINVDHTDVPEIDPDIICHKLSLKI